ncbi:MAG: DUF4112 domain-containing protein [Deltaproteobacteria bacterium]|nr:DUF4112 domain-containing protein [Deltaproteobacteria bacterium]
MTASQTHDPALTKAVQRAERVARWMDGKFLDPILGLLVPGLGDLTGLMIGLYTVHLAHQAKISPAILARMIANLALDALVGGIPLLGDVFDLVFRAHTRNLELLKRRPDGSARPGDWLVLAGALVLLLAALAAPVLVFVALLKWIFS